MPITIEKLIDLYILQKDYHTKEAQAVARFEQEFKSIIQAYGVEITEHFATALPSVPDQPLIPFVLYKPATATKDSPKPLIIHTHGGPHVFVDKDKPHAEIAYYLSHGYVVACPNYRGSALYPKASKNPEEWTNWIKRSKDKHHICGPEDVYAVTTFVRNLSFIKKDKIFLRGMSFGSHINSHLLTLIKQGRFENIYSGVQLTSGVLYPVSEDMPTDFPILISHAISDNIASFKDARLFMEKLLLKRVATKQTNLQTFISNKGNHHLINASLNLEDKQSESYLELKRFFELSTQFIHQIAQGAEFKADDVLLQLENVACQDEENKIENVNQLVQAHTYITSLPLAEMSSAASGSKASSSVKSELLTPTMAHLKLVLGEEFTGEVRIDLVNYLQNHFKPLEWERPRIVLENAGSDLLKDHRLMEQLFTVIEDENTFLSSRPDYMVLYHAAENTALQLYSLITLWKKMLKGDFSPGISVITEMRFFDFMSVTFEDIDIFLHKMREKRADDDRRAKTTSDLFDFSDDEEEKPRKISTVFNHLPGFAERALAWNPALTSNQHTTASCTLWWYFQSVLKATMEEAPCARVIDEMLMALNLSSASRVNRYLQLFERNKQTLEHEGKKQGVLQQVFLPTALADKKAYVCQIWGEEFNKAGDAINLSRPSTLTAFRQSPHDFELKLRQHSKVFVDYKEVNNFGFPNFQYANLLQVRYLFKNTSQIQIASHFRHPQAFHEFAVTLQQIVKEDFADFIVRGAIIPRGVVESAEAIRLKIKYNLQIKTEDAIPEGVLYLQQKELCKGLVENPHFEIYGDAVKASKKTKVNIQTRLGDLRFFMPKKVQLYALCRYLKGYTYYDLLKEAAQATILNGTPNSAHLQEYRKENYEFVMANVEKFALASSANSQFISPNEYLRLREIINNSIRRYPYDARKGYEFFQMQGTEVYEENLFYNEINNAIEAFLTYARLAKEASYGHDIREQQRNYY